MYVFAPPASSFRKNIKPVSTLIVLSISNDFVVSVIIIDIRWVRVVLTISVVLMLRVDATMLTYAHPQHTKEDFGTAPRSGVEHCQSKGQASRRRLQKLSCHHLHARPPRSIQFVPQACPVTTCSANGRSFKANSRGVVILHVSSWIKIIKSLFHLDAPGVPWAHGISRSFSATPGHKTQPV